MAAIDNANLCSICYENLRSKRLPNGRVEHLVTGHWMLEGKNFISHIYHDFCCRQQEKCKGPLIPCPGCLPTEEQINAREKTGWVSAMHFSQYLRQKELYLALLSDDVWRFNAALPNASALDLRALLYFAARDGHGGILQTILDADLNQSDNLLRLTREARFEALQAAIPTGRTDFVRQFLVHDDHLLSHRRCNPQHFAFTRDQRGRAESADPEYKAERRPVFWQGVRLPFLEDIQVCLERDFSGPNEFTVGNSQRFEWLLGAIQVQDWAIVQQLIHSDCFLQQPENQMHPVFQECVFTPEQREMALQRAFDLSKPAVCDESKKRGCWEIGTFSRKLVYFLLERAGPFSPTSRCLNQLMAEAVENVDLDFVPLILGYLDPSSPFWGQAIPAAAEQLKATYSPVRIQAIRNLFALLIHRGLSCFSDDYDLIIQEIADRLPDENLPHLADFGLEMARILQLLLPLGTLSKGLCQEMQERIGLYAAQSGDVKLLETLLQTTKGFPLSEKLAGKLLLLAASKREENISLGLIDILLTNCFISKDIQEKARDRAEALCNRTCVDRLQEKGCVIV